MKNRHTMQKSYISTINDFFSKIAGLFFFNSASPEDNLYVDHKNNLFLNEANNYLQLYNTYLETDLKVLSDLLTMDEDQLGEIIDRSSDDRLPKHYTYGEILYNFREYNLKASSYDLLITIIRKENMLLGNDFSLVMKADAALFSNYFGCDYSIDDNGKVHSKKFRNLAQVATDFFTDNIHNHPKKEFKLELEKNVQKRLSSWIEKNFDPETNEVSSNIRACISK